MKIKSTVLTLLAGTAWAKEGISFVVIGDWGSMSNLDVAREVFKDINNLKRDAVQGSAEDFDFMITVGDNIYPEDGQNPTDDEFKAMLDLIRTREHLKDLEVYPVRGNHDCYFDPMNEEMKLKSQMPTWEMPANFYTKNWTLNEQGDMFALMAFDSCFYLCETVNMDKERYYPLLSEESKTLYD